MDQTYVGLTLLLTLSASLEAARPFAAFSYACSGGER